MRRYLILCTLICLYLPAFGVEQKYVPDGYFRDDALRPYFVQYVSEYFKKVDSGKMECSWKTYRKQVEAPLSKDIERLYIQSVQGLCPRD